MVRTQFRHHALGMWVPLMLTAAGLILPLVACHMFGWIWVSALPITGVIAYTWWACRAVEFDYAFRALNRHEYPLYPPAVWTTMRLVKLYSGTRSRLYVLEKAADAARRRAATVTGCVETLALEAGYKRMTGLDWLKAQFIPAHQDINAQR